MGRGERDAGWNPRVVLAAGALVLASAVAVAVLALGGSDGEEGGGETVRARLTLERFEQPGTGAPELLVTLPDKQLNVPETTDGKTSVLLRCFDAGGSVLLRRPTDWPLLEELGYPLPHIHHVASPRLLRRIRACRVTGPGLALAGRVPGPLPRAAQ